MIVAPMPVNQRRCQRQCSQVLVDAYSAPAIRHGKGTRTGATRERGRQPPADGPKPTNRAYAREPRAAPQSHDSRVDCTSGCCDRGASPELLPADDVVKWARQCHLHAPANRARSPNPTTIARAETRIARQRRPPVGSYNATHGAPQADHWQPRCLRHGILQTARSPNPPLIARQHVHRERPTGSTCRQMTMPVLASPRRCPRGARYPCAVTPTRTERNARLNLGLRHPRATAR